MCVHCPTTSASPCGDTDILCGRNRGPSKLTGYASLNSKDVLSCAPLVQRFEKTGSRLSAVVGQWLAERHVGIATVSVALGSRIRYILKLRRDNMSCTPQSTTPRTIPSYAIPHLTQLTFLVKDICTLARRRICRHSRRPQSATNSSENKKPALDRTL